MKTITKQTAGTTPATLGEFEKKYGLPKYFHKGKNKYYGKIRSIATRGRIAPNGQLAVAALFQARAVELQRERAQGIDTDIFELCKDFEATPERLYKNMICFLEFAGFNGSPGIPYRRDSGFIQTFMPYMDEDNDCMGYAFKTSDGSEGSDTIASGDFKTFIEICGTLLAD